MYSIIATDVQRAGPVLARLCTDNLPVLGNADDKLRWFYRDNPHGPGTAFLLTAAEVAVGCAGLGVRRLHHHGRPLRGAVFADLAIEPRHRAGLPALMLVRSVRAEVERCFDLGYGFPNPKAVAVYLRAGYTELGRMYRHVRVLRTRRYLQRSLGWLAGPAAAIADLGIATLTLARAARARDATLRWVGEVDERFDTLWEAVRDELPLACARDAAFLRWRLAREPHRIACVTSPDARKLRAYAVVKDAEDDCVDVVDFLGRSERDLDALFALLVRETGKLGRTALRCRFLGNERIVRLLARHGFVRRGEPRTIVVAEGRASELAALRDVGSWYLTDLDEDN